MSDTGRPFNSITFIAYNTAKDIQKGRGTYLHHTASVRATFRMCLPGPQTHVLSSTVFVDLYEFTQGHTGSKLQVVFMDYITLIFPGKKVRISLSQRQDRMGMSR